MYIVKNHILILCSVITMLNKCSINIFTLHPIRTANPNKSGQTLCNLKIFLSTKMKQAPPKDRTLKLKKHTGIRPVCKDVNTYWLNKSSSQMRYFVLVSELV